MAEDLRTSWKRRVFGDWVFAETDETGATSRSGHRRDPPADTTKVDSDSRPIKIVPKGLRAFDEQRRRLLRGTAPGPA